MTEIWMRSSTGTLLKKLNPSTKIYKRTGFKTIKKKSCSFLFSVYSFYFLEKKREEMKKKQRRKGGEI